MIFWGTFLVLFFHNFIIRGDVYLHVYIDLGVVFILHIFLIVLWVFALWDRLQTSSCLFRVLLFSAVLLSGVVFFCAVFSLVFIFTHLYRCWLFASLCTLKQTSQSFNSDPLHHPQIQRVAHLIFERQCSLNLKFESLSKSKWVWWRRSTQIFVQL